MRRTFELHSWAQLLILPPPEVGLGTARRQFVCTVPSLSPERGVGNALVPHSFYVKTGFRGCLE